MIHHSTEVRRLQVPARTVQYIRISSMYIQLFMTCALLHVPSEYLHFTIVISPIRVKPDHHLLFAWLNYNGCGISFRFTRVDFRLIINSSEDTARTKVSKLVHEWAIYLMSYSFHNGASFNRHLLRSFASPSRVCIWRQISSIKWSCLRISVAIYILSMVKRKISANVD